jgi:transposase
VSATSQERTRTALRYGMYAACTILSIVSIETTAFGLAMILPGSTIIAYVVASVLQLIIVSASWLFFSTATGRIDPGGSWFRSGAMLATCSILWMVGASFSVAGSFLAFDLRLSDHRARALSDDHQVATLMFGSKVAGQLSERLTFTRARHERLAHLRDDEIAGRISGQAGCRRLCRGLHDRTVEIEGLIARLDALAADLKTCATDDVACSQNVLERAVGIDPILGRTLAETADYLGANNGARYLPEDWTVVAFSAPPLVPAIRAADPERLAGFSDLFALRTESLYALAASLGIEVLLLVIACLGVLLVPPARAPVREEPRAVEVTEPSTKSSNRTAYPPALKSRLIHVAGRLTKQGRSIREVAEVLRLPQSTLRRWLHSTPPKLKVLPLEHNAETTKLLGAVARRLHEDGTGISAVAKTLGVSSDVVRTWLELGEEPETDPALHAV